MFFYLEFSILRLPDMFLISFKASVPAIFNSNSSLSPKVVDKSGVEVIAQFSHLCKSDM